ncbi:MAG: hypothetical protein HQ591_08855 [candidate division Zixibacteria bacterium]|nr:hypothetical protein [Candidatus Tariuqbacter arcticus]
MAVLAQSLLALVSGYLSPFALFTAWHRFSYNFLNFKLFIGYPVNSVKFIAPLQIKQVTNLSNRASRFYRRMNRKVNPPNRQILMKRIDSCKMKTIGLRTGIPVIFKVKINLHAGSRHNLE